ncbi:hypothetical protein GCM10007108_12370 [Thermogymnomonas acidicola]|uniref:NfeD-like C-terminal domain-containing protein n=1 Tax=Thermogymnomonas acidicola TaxID=399579 RepID=A0AA37BSC4_9ARCH|nr:NfeD family protein [Thermogymnomonas acidicola]GGM75960.1 hypothetical protein GCM10007108_12370 [Thermogymnomonas acidicola]
MYISSLTFDAEIILTAVLAFFFGAWFARLFLRRPWGRKPVTGKEALIGSRAIVKSISNGNVTVSVNSQLWSAIVVGPSINVGDEVIVLGVDGLKLRVARLDRQQIIAPPDEGV